MARAKLDEATAALEADPPQTDEAATLAQTSSYQAQLALAIAQQVQQVRDKETSIEDLVLANQARLGRIAGTAGTTADFSSGAEPVEAELRAELERLKAMESELNQSRRQVLAAGKCSAVGRSSTPANRWPGRRSVTPPGARR